MNAKLLSFFVVFSALTSAIAQNDSATITNHPAFLHIETVKVDVSGGLTHFIVFLSNGSPAAVRFSTYDLVRKLDLISFYDSDGKKWQIKQNEVITDPPEPEIDFKQVLGSWKQVRLELSTGIMNSKTSSSNLLPEKMRYQIKGNLRCADLGLKHFWEAALTGQGEANVDWITRHGQAQTDAPAKYQFRKYIMLSSSLTSYHYETNKSEH